MKKFVLRLCVAATVTLFAGMSAATADPSGAQAVGSRLINGDGDTSGTCLEILEGGTTNWIGMRGCHVNAHQSWYFTTHTGGYVAIRSHDTDAAGDCLTASSELWFGEADMEDCENQVQADQAWTQINHANGWFQLHSKAYPGSCLSVVDSGQRDEIVRQPCGGSNQGNQLWHWHSV